jgi:hypothetical protein
MFLATHAAAGILIGQYVNNPLAVFGLSFASHFVLDFIPHGDEHLYHDEEWREQRRYRRAALINALDLTALIGLLLWLISRPDQPRMELMMIGVLGSVLPDFLSHFFPVIHQRFSWLWLMRWIYKLTKPTGLRYIVRGQDWIHNLLHHEILRRDIPFLVGLSIQIVLIVVFLNLIH